MYSAHGGADGLGKIGAHILILGLVRMDTNRSKDVLKLDVVIDYDGNFGYLLP
jgi:hypothetical protein